MFKRLFKVTESNLNSVMDQLEDPIKMTEQGIRDLKKDLQAAMESLAQVKAMSIRTRKEVNANKGTMDTTEAERLATLALEKQAELASEAKRLGDEATGHETMSATINTSVSKLRSTLTTYDNELLTLKARAKTAASTKKINAQLSTMDASGTITMLERMKERVEEEESLASAYGDMVDQTDTDRQTPWKMR